VIDDPDVRILHGGALEQLATLQSESVQCIVTSPPFWGLRDYGHAEQIGLEPTPEAWVEALVGVFRECRRVLRPDGVFWLEVGDTYNNRTVSRTSSHHAGLGYTSREIETSWRDHATNGRTRMSIADGDLKEKDLVGAPWMLAFALRADGWWLRSECIWHRPNPMPESVIDRPTKAHSQVFLLTKQARYFFDADAIREPLAPDSAARAERASRYDDPEVAAGVPYGATRPRVTKRRSVREGVDTNGGGQGSGEMGWDAQLGANARSVWSIPTQPTPFAHFATMPEELARRCIAAGTSEAGRCPECGAPWRRIAERTREDVPGGSREQDWTTPKNDGVTPFQKSPPRYRNRVETVGWAPQCECGADEEHDGYEPVPCTVLDPFMGSGTTALVARKLGRRAIGVELNAAYLEIARERLSQQSLFA